MQNGIYFFKVFNQINLNLLRSLEKNFKIAAMDEEGLMFFDHETYIRRFSEKNFELTDIFFLGVIKKKSLIIKISRL